MRNVAGSILNHTGYACQMKSLIQDWRSVWSAVPNTTSPLFPFGVTQLAGSCSEGFPANAGAFRRAQTGGYGHLPNADMPNTFLGQAFDLGDPWQHGCMNTRACYGWEAPYSLNLTHNYENSAIHPRPKLPLGQRLARAYRAVTAGAPPLLPVLTGCSAVAGRGRGATNEGGRAHAAALRLTFGGLRGASLAQPTFSDKWAGASGVELEIGGEWTFIDTVGLNISRESANAIDVQLPPAPVAVTGVRYAWADNPCCGANNRTVDPCPPMACPLLTTGDLPEPVVPFLASIVVTDQQTGSLKCACDPPMVC